MTEKLLGIITRASVPSRLFPHDVVLAFTDKRIIVLKSGTTKSLLVPGIAGSLWTIAEYLKQDKLASVPIDQLEEKMEYEIPRSEIMNMEVERSWGATNIKIKTNSKSYIYRTMEDQKRVQKVVDSFFNQG